MIRKLTIALLCVLLFADCKKNNDDNDDGGGGNGGGNDLSGNYIMRTPQLCLGSYYVSEKLSGNLVDHQISLTSSDTLNSWYLKKQSNGKYIIYSKLGADFLIWKEGEEATVNIGTYNRILLVKTNSLPAGDAEPERQFTITRNDNTDQYRIKAYSGYVVNTAKGTRKGTDNCTREQTPILMPANNSCRDVNEGAVVFIYCFFDLITLQKI